MSAPDVLVIGGGPGGSTAALLLARAGLRVRLYERERFPRFHVGESFLPATLEALRELGLAEALRALPHTVKRGAEFAFAGDDPAAACHIRFDQALRPGPQEAFNIARADFDALLLDAAVAAGVEHERAEVLAVEATTPGAMRLRLRDAAGERVDEGRWLIDASGQSALLGRRLGIRVVEESLRKMAFFQHFTGVERLSDDAAGDISIHMCAEGWLWAIPLDGERTSVGLVLDRDQVRSAGVPAERLLHWAIERCPRLRARMQQAQGPARCNVLSDFSYRCEPCAGLGWFLVGDAAAFLDPIFSTGVSMAMAGARAACAEIVAVEAGRRSPTSAARAYRRFVAGSSRPLFALVRDFYRHPFRELLVHGRGPLRVHRAVISLVAGHVFPRPHRAVRWRLRLMRLFAALQRRLPLVPRRSAHSLFAATPEPLPVTREPT